MRHAPAPRAPRLSSLSVALLPTLGLAVFATAALRGAPASADPPSPVSGVEDAMMAGARHFDEAIAWVARGGSLGRARDFYASLDTRWDLPGKQPDEGSESVWFSTPGKLRIEARVLGGTTTKILDGDRGWSVQAETGVRRLHGTPEGQGSLAQLHEDLERLEDLAAFLTLEGLKGPGITFQFLGRTEGTGVFEGKWLKIARRAPDAAKMTFWIAYEVDADGRAHATWPGAVEVEGSVAAEGKPAVKTEQWVLRGWDAPTSPQRPYRYPNRIQGIHSSADPAARADPDPTVRENAKPRVFLKAFVKDIRMNAGVDPALFAPPATGAPK